MSKTCRSDREFGDATQIKAPTDGSYCDADDREYYVLLTSRSYEKACAFLGEYGPYSCLNPQQVYPHDAGVDTPPVFVGDEHETMLFLERRRHYPHTLFFTLETAAPKPNGTQIAYTRDGCMSFGLNFQAYCPVELERREVLRLMRSTGASRSCCTTALGPPSSFNDFVDMIEQPGLVSH